MILSKRVATSLLICTMLAGGAVTCVEVTAMLDSKNIRIDELEKHIKDTNEDLNETKKELLDAIKYLEDSNNKLKQLEEDNEAILLELDTKSRRLEEFEAILSSSIIDITLAELDLFFRLVEAEAGNEDMRGKVAVANVVINRVRDNRYPDTVTDVIYQPKQFQPASNGHINKIASKETKEAVLRALMGEEVVSKDTIIFWATYLDKSHELWRLPITATIGGHVFTTSY